MCCVVSHHLFCQIGNVVQLKVCCVSVACLVKFEWGSDHCHVIVSNAERNVSGT